MARQFGYSQMSAQLNERRTEKWISLGLIMMLSDMPILFVLSFFIVGHLHNDAVAGGMAAIIYSFILFWNRVILLIKGFLTKHAFTDPAFR